MGLHSHIPFPDTSLPPAAIFKGKLRNPVLLAVREGNRDSILGVSFGAESRGVLCRSLWVRIPFSSQQFQCRDKGRGWHRTDLWVEWAQRSTGWRKARACQGKLCSHRRQARREGSGGDTVRHSAVMGVRSDPSPTVSLCLHISLTLTVIPHSPFPPGTANGIPLLQSMSKNISDIPDSQNPLRTGLLSAAPPFPK